jgi:hypothetical protein
MNFNRIVSFAFFAAAVRRGFEAAKEVVWLAHTAIEAHTD